MFWTSTVTKTQLWSVYFPLQIGLYFYETTFQDKSTHTIFKYQNLTNKKQYATEIWMVDFNYGNPKMSLMWLQGVLPVDNHSKDQVATYSTK